MLTPTKPRTRAHEIELAHQIIAMVCLHLKASRARVYGQCRQRQTVQARKMAMWLIYEETALNATAIAELMQCHHSVVKPAAAQMRAKAEKSIEAYQQALELKHEVMGLKTMQEAAA